MKKILRFLTGLIIILFAVTYIPQFAHICTKCETFFIGAGYDPNIVVGMLNSEDGILCKACAQKHHVLATSFGKSIDDYKKSVELNPLTVIQQWFE